MNTMITDAAVEASLARYLELEPLEAETNPMDHTTRAFMRELLEAALPHIADAPEAGNPVSVSERERFEVWAKSENFDVSYYGGMDDWYKSIETHSAWRAWQAARQPVGEAVAFDQQVADFLNGCPVAHVPVHPRQGPLWSETLAAASEAHRSNSYPLMPLYAVPPQQLAKAVDLWKAAVGEFIEGDDPEFLSIRFTPEFLAAWSASKRLFGTKLYVRCPLEVPAEKTEADYERRDPYCDAAPSNMDAYSLGHMDGWNDLRKTLIDSQESKP